ncbi:MAG: AAA family ATPase [Anaerolineaceae bacterium]
MYNNGVILMTALVPTVGHQYLVEMAQFGCEKLTVIICGRSHEPVPGLQRILAFKRQFDRDDYPWIKFVLHEDNDAPQNPPDGDQSGFWDYWKAVVEKHVEGAVDAVFVSEPYGKYLADVLDADFLPIDVNRNVFPVKGERARSEIRRLDGRVGSKIMPGFRPFLQRNVTLFGQESVGKTTLTRKLADYYFWQESPEWARQYLENTGLPVNEVTMRNILFSQTNQQHAIRNMTDKLVTVRDTDLISTYGYYKLMMRDGRLPYNMKFLEEIKAGVRIHQENFKNDIHVLLNPKGFPFVPDPLRYGGDKRETDIQYWRDILEEFGIADYIEVDARDMDAVSLVQILKGHPKFRVHQEIGNFKRE